MSVQETKLKAIADAIRAKNGTSAAIPANDFASRILAISTMPDTVRTVSISSGNPSLGSVSGGGLADVGMEVVVTATPSGSNVFKNWTENGAIVSTDKKYGLKVTGNKTLVGNFGTGYVSGVDWLEAKLPSTGNWSSVAYGGGVFVAVQNGGSVAAYSFNGKDWYPTEIPSGYYGFVGYEDGGFTAYPNNPATTHVAISSDGITWIQRDISADYSLSDVTGAAFGNHMHVAVQSNDTGIPYSANTINWYRTVVDVNGGYFCGIVYADGKFVTVKDAAGTGYTTAFTSTDGIEWKSQSISSFDGTRGIAFGGGRFVFVTYDGNRVYSSDGKNWQGTGATGKHWNCIAYGDGKFVTLASGNSGSNAASFSPDGINWTDATLPITAKWKSIAFGGGKFVALAEGLDTILYSYTGT